MVCRSSQDIDVFSIKLSVYTCLSFVQVTQNNYIYYIGTPVEPMVKERVFANSNELNVTMSEVCTALNTVDNMYNLIKNGMVWFLIITRKYTFIRMITIVLYALLLYYVSEIMLNYGNLWFTVSSEDIVKTNCPNILKNSFASLAVEENGVENVCGNGVINGCFGNPEVVISTRLSCHSNSFISGKDPLFTELFYDEFLYCSIMHLKTIPKTFVIWVAEHRIHLCHSVN